MKILHVITSLLTGGAEKLMVDLLPRMRALGYDVELCIFCGDRTPFYEQLDACGVKTYSFHKGLKGLYSPMNIVRLRKVIKQGNYDVIHTHNTAPQLFAAIAGLGTNVKLVTTEHNTDNRRRKIPMLKLGDKWMYSRYSKVICISDQAEINLREYLHASDTTKICTIYNGIDYNKYAQAEPADDIIQLKVDAPKAEADGDVKVITMVAAFRPQKDHKTMIKAMEYLPDNYHLCLVGSGELFEEIRAYANSFAYKDRIHLTGLRNDIPNVLSASDFVVMSSHYEGLSLSNLEGMASGKPFIASDVDGLREIVKGNGVLVEHENATALAEAIMKLDADAEYRAQIIKKCQAKAFQYDISNMAESYLSVYEKLMNNGKN